MNKMSFIFLTVSKPNANSPVVKKTTIARPSPDAVPKEGVKNYQKVDTTKKFQGTHCIAPNFIIII